MASLERSTFDEGSVAPAAGKEPGEYPFPQVLVPGTMDARNVGEGSTRRELEQQKEVTEVATPLKKKSKKSRKEKEDSERDTGTTRNIKGNEVGQDQMTYETHKRRSHPVTFEEDQPNEKRPHLREPTPESMSKRETLVTEHAKPDIESPMTRSTTLEAKSTDRGLGLAQEPTWSFSGVEGNESNIAESSVKRRVPSYDESTRDSGYHGSTHSTIMPQDPVQEVEAPSREKKRRSKEPKTPREKLIRDSQGADSSPSFPEFSPAGAATTPTAQEYATKERTSYLFDSSPSTRAYGTSPAVDPTTPAHDNRRDSRSPTKEVSKSSGKSRRVSIDSRQEERPSTEESKTKEPYQSIFGDPTEKTSGPSGSQAAPVSKLRSTPSNKQLQTITETSPDDSPLHKKGRAINDVGAPDRGTKSARRTETPKPFSERMKSPAPVTPTPLSRKGGPSATETAGRNSPVPDSPWHQVNDKVDRTMTLSPARRMPRSSPSFDPIKQHMAEQRSPSVVSQRSMSNISKLRSPDQERPLSSASNRSTQSLRRVDRSASGDLRAVARLGEASAQDANNAEPNLTGIAAAAGATAAIAGIAAASKYDPVRGAGKGRRASMAAETFVSIQTDLGRQCAAC